MSAGNGIVIEFIDQIQGDLHSHPLSYRIFHLYLMLGIPGAEKRLSYVNWQYL